MGIDWAQIRGYLNDIVKEIAFDLNRFPTGFFEFEQKQHSNFQSIGAIVNVSEDIFQIAVGSTDRLSTFECARFRRNEDQEINR